MNATTIHPLNGQIAPPRKEWLLKDNNVKMIEVLALIDDIRDIKDPEWRAPCLELCSDGSGKLIALSYSKSMANSSDRFNRLEFINLEGFFLTKVTELRDSLAEGTTFEGTF